jgi:hypothetical protein
MRLALISVEAIAGGEARSPDRSGEAVCPARVLGAALGCHLGRGRLLAIWKDRDTRPLSRPGIVPG